MMKDWLMIGIATLLSVGVATADEVNPGDSRETVLRTLGNPSGTVMFGDVEILHYPRGQVELEHGKVVGSSILTEAEFRRREAARRAEEEEEVARRQAEEQEARERVLEEQEVAEEEPVEREDPEAMARREAELEARIAEGIRQPPHDMSSRRLRRFRRGRSESLLELREEQIREEFEAEE